MTRTMLNAFAILVFSVLPFVAGCGGLTLGPVIEKKAIIVRAGTGIEIVEQTAVEARVLNPDGPSDLFEQDIGGWIALHPDHWQAVKNEVENLRAECKRLRVLAGLDSPPGAAAGQ